MVIIILIICGLVISFLTYCLFSTFNDNNWDIIECIKNDSKGFFWSLIAITISFVIAYFCFVTPTSFISNQYVHKNGTMTSVEYSLTGDSVIMNNIKMPVSTYGRVTKVYHGSRLMGKIQRYYTSITVKLNDGREMKTEISQDRNIKEGNGMSITETFYPSYQIDYNFN